MVDDSNLIRRMCASDPFTVAATPPAAVGPSFTL